MVRRCRLRRNVAQRRAAGADMKAIDRRPARQRVKNDFAVRHQRSLERRNTGGYGGGNARQKRRLDELGKGG